MNLKTLAITGVAVLALAGCSQTTDAAPTPTTNSSNSTSTAPASTKPSPTAAPSVYYSAGNGHAEDVFGEENFGEGGTVVTSLVTKWVGATFANSQVVTGDITPAEAVRGLPIVGSPAKTAAQDPTSWTLVSFTDKAAGRVGVSAELVEPEKMEIIWGTNFVNDVGEKQKPLDVRFDATVRVTYTENGETFTLDGVRWFRLLLLPGTDPAGDKWVITGFENGPVRWAEPVLD